MVDLPVLGTTLSDGDHRRGKRVSEVVRRLSLALLAVPAEGGSDADACVRRAGLLVARPGKEIVYAAVEEEARGSDHNKANCVYNKGRGASRRTGTNQEGVFTRAVRETALVFGRLHSMET
jgi:hypothetical protein